MKGHLAPKYDVKVCQSNAGYYIGTTDEDGMPYSRESQEYWRSQQEAETALQYGEWTQRPNP